MDDGRGRGGGGAGLGVEDVVELDEEQVEEGEGGAGGEDALAQHGAPWRPRDEVAAELGMVRVPHRPGQQAKLRDQERQPAYTFICSDTPISEFQIVHMNS